MLWASGSSCGPPEYRLATRLKKMGRITSLAYIVAADIGITCLIAELNNIRLHLRCLQSRQKGLFGLFKAFRNVLGQTLDIYLEYVFKRVPNDRWHGAT